MQDEIIPRNVSTTKNVPGYLLEPVDIQEVAYIHNPVDACNNRRDNKSEVFMIMFVISSPHNFKRRELIRNSYGNANVWKSAASRETEVKTVFMLGSTANASVQSMIDRESVLHQDIVQEDMIDDYKKLTRKTIMGLKWVTNYCPQAKFTMKLDDDVVVNVERILNMLWKAPRQNFTAGQALFASPVVRDKNSEFGKFYLPAEYYPESIYPPYLTGQAYIMSKDLVEATYRTALTTPLFPWEDVFIGICLQKLGVKLRARLNHQPRTSSHVITACGQTFTEGSRVRIRAFIEGGIARKPKTFSHHYSKSGDRWAL
ncbi:beta-1,3-galactosyltransferase 1-like [Diadema antillarum]|uniref:beta-1,3-galactosyltransferase 1-like n=1 Tax=Diadema antillarum TaxID=105358 RepID=UPI003A850EFF